MKHSNASTTNKLLIVDQIYMCPLEFTQKMPRTCYCCFSQRTGNCIECGFRLSLQQHIRRVECHGPLSSAVSSLVKYPCATTSDQFSHIVPISNLSGGAQWSSVTGENRQTSYLVCFWLLHLKIGQDFTTCFFQRYYYNDRHH